MAPVWVYQNWWTGRKVVWHVDVKPHIGWIIGEGYIQLLKRCRLGAGGQHGQER